MASPPSSKPPTLLLRPCQQRIARIAVEGNTIVLLPTGAGKTLIAAECAKQLRRRVLFFVPTCLLVAQQSAAVRVWTSLTVVEFMGGARPPPLAFDVLVTTPKAFEMLQKKAGKTGEQQLAWDTFGLVVFDEVHHVLKDHPYRKLAAALKRSGAAPRVLGLSASLTYAVGAKKVEAAVQRLCDELQITSLATADRAELLASGYHASSVPAEVIPVTVPPSELPSGLVPEADRRPHLLAATFFARVRSATATPFALRLIAAIRGMEAAVVAELPAGTFTSPLDGGRPSLKEWGAYAHTLAARHRSRRFAELEHWYEALRLLVVSWEAAEDAATEFLRMMTGGGNGDGAPGCCWRSSTAAPARAAFWAAAPASFPRFSHLKDILHYTLDSAEYLEREFRGILFVEQRAMTHVLAHVVAGDPELAARLSPACLYACSSPATPSLAVTRRAQSFKVLADFASGRTNLLICTVVAEEGMDVPAATNCVIRFDPMPAAQRVLRAGPRPCPPG